MSSSVVQAGPLLGVFRVLNIFTAQRFRRVLIECVSVAVVATGVTLLADAPQATAVESTASTTAPAGLGKGDLDATPGLPDTVSAMVTAQASGVRVEDVSQRTSDTRTYAMPDGTWTADSYAEPVFVHDGDPATEPGVDGTGAWHEIDTTLVHADGGWRPAHANTQVVFSDGGDETFAQLSRGRQEVAYSLGGDNTALDAVTLPAPVVRGDTIVYPDIVPDVLRGVDLVARATTNGFTHWLVLSQRPTPAQAEELSFPVVLTQAGTGGDLEVAEKSSGALAVTDSDAKPGATGSAEKPILTAAPPVAWDASTSGPDDTDPARTALTMLDHSVPALTTPSDDGSPSPTTAESSFTSEAPAAVAPDTTASVESVPVDVTVSNGVDIDTSSKGSGDAAAVIDLSTDPAFLTDPATTYPVTIDPSNVVGTTGDTWVQKPGYESGQPSSTQLLVGTKDAGAHKARSFIEFASSKWSGKHVTSAQLVLRNFDQSTCASGSIQVGRIRSSWNPSTLTWGNQPTSVDAAVLASGLATDCPANHSATWNITGIVQSWAYGTVANWGLRLISNNESASATWRAYRSANFTTDTDVRPHISYAYNSFPNTAGAVTVTSAPAGNAGYSRSATPTVQAKVSDPDASNVRAQFEVFNSAGTRVMATLSPYVANGGTATLKTSSLPDGAYTVKAIANDGTDYTRNSANTAYIYGPSTSFTVDTTASAATVTSSAFTNGQWRVDRPATNTFTLTGAADVKSFTYSKDGAAPVTVAAASGTASLVWLPADGAHTLSVYATDKAGNVGATSTFNYGLGAPSLDTTSLPSTGTFPLQLKGPPNSTGATLSWRYAGHPNDTWRTLTGVTTSAGAGWSSAVTTTAGASTTPSLVWDATQQADSDSTEANPTYIDAPAFVEVRGCFTYSSGTSPICSDPQKLQLVASAFGGNFPTTSLGPATVALFTGETTLSEPDAVDTAAGVGRTFTTFDSSTFSDPTAAGVFGPGWSTTLSTTGESEAELVDHRTKDGTLVLVTAGGVSQIYTPVNATADVASPTSKVVFKPAGVDDDSRITLDPTSTPATGVWTATLVEPQGAAGGATTVWTRPTSGDDAGTWVFDSATSAEADKNDPEVAVTTNSAGLLTWIAESEPGDAVTCTATTQTPGCRGLKITYSTHGTGTSAVQRVSQIDRLVASSDGTTTSTSTQTLATYAYTDAGTTTSASALLAKACGPDPDGTATTYQPLCSTYDYDTTSVAFRTLLKKLTPAGQKPWEFTYDNHGRLTSVSRAIDTSDTTGTGPAVWRVVYDIDPTVTAANDLPDMSTSQIARWGQTLAPLRAAAVYTPDDGLTAAPTAGDLSKADLYYYDISGTETNTAVHGNTTPDGTGTGEWLVDTSWYDKDGNTIRTLDAAGRQAALASSSDADVQTSTASLLSSYTIYSTDGSRVEDEYGPAHTATLTNGTTATYRPHTSYIYDGTTDTAHSSATLGGTTKPAYPDGTTTYDLVVQERHSAADTGMVPDDDSEHDTTLVDYVYDPIVTSDGSGWTLGSPTQTTTQITNSTWATAISRSDPDGRQIETRQPGGGADSTGAGNDAQSTLTSYYLTGATDSDCTLTGHPERARWTGMVCKTKPAAQPVTTSATPTIPTTYYNSYDDNLQPLLVTETSGATVRTLTTSYDIIGRPKSDALNISGNGALADSRLMTYSYDPVSGLETAASDTGSTGVTTASTVTTVHDTWGRAKSYTDATGTTSTTTYTPEGRTATTFDGAGTYTYTYATTGGEQRGVVTSVDVGLASGVADVFGLRYTAAGSTSRVTYPTGMTADYGYDEAGTATSLVYTQDDTELLGFTNDVDVDGRTIAATSASSERAYTYDKLGRLTQTADTNTADNTCTTRAYGFNVTSERTSFASYGAADDGSCQTTTPTVSKTNTYDTANRITNTGYTYDTLGRTLTTPATDTNIAGQAGASALTAAYYANDMVKTLTQTVPDNTGGTVVKQNNYTLDPAGRITDINTTSTAGDTSHTQYRYSNDSDSPTQVFNHSSANGTTADTTTRYLQIPGLGMVASVTDGTLTLQISNLHGDTVTTQTAGEPGIGAYTETDEYGNTVGAEENTSRYGWLGAAQRSTDTLGGLVLMGARTYNAATGQFNSIDSITDGNETRFNYPTDPINKSDAAGTCQAGVVDVIIDTHGFVGVPKAYCYDPHRKSGKTLHDYCSSWAPDAGFFGGKTVSFKGPCAYHDMCIDFGWGKNRGDCDHVLKWEMLRNCNYVLKGFLQWPARRVCSAAANTYYAAVTVGTWKGKYSAGVGLRCHIDWKSWGGYPECK